MCGPLGKSERSVVILAEDRQREVKRAVKIAVLLRNNRYFERESSIHT
jgi:hypothetical protein